MSEFYGDDDPETEILQRQLAEDINSGDYVVWDRWTQKEGETWELLLTFSGIEAKRTVNPTSRQRTPT